MVKSEVSAISNEDELKKIFDTKSGIKEKNLKANTMLEKMGFRDEELTSKTHDDIFIELMNKELLFSMGLFINKYIDKTDMTITPEYPIVTNNSFVIGYIDILLKTCNEIIPIEIKTKLENNIGATIRQINTYKLHIKSSDFVIIAPEITNKQKDILKMSGIHSISMKDIYETEIKYKKFKDNFIDKCIPKIISELGKENEVGNEVTINTTHFGNSFGFDIIHRTIKDILTNTNICIKDSTYANRIVFCHKSYILGILKKRQKERIEKEQKEKFEKIQKEELEKRQKEELEKIESHKLEKEFKNRNPNEF